jgi:hypothetical protein
LAKPRSLHNTISNKLVFCFCIRARYCVLSLGGPGDEVVTKEDYIPGRGPTSVGAPGPIGVRVDHKLGCGLSTKKKTKIQSVLKIAYNAFQGNHVTLSQIMHVEADLLNYVRNIRASEC